jgi:hypothetical protein
LQNALLDPTTSGFRTAASIPIKVAIEAFSDGKTIAEIAQKHDVHPN